MKKFTIAALLTGILFVGCTSPTEGVPEEPIVPDVPPPVVQEEPQNQADGSAMEGMGYNGDGSTIDGIGHNEDGSVEVEDPVVGEEEQEPEARTIMIHVSNWEFTPSTITVKKDENVSLYLMGMEGSHGLEIPGLGISETIGEGDMKTIKIPTDKPGTYNFFCNVVCGLGHGDMIGTIVIEE